MVRQWDYLRVRKAQSPSEQAKIGDYSGLRFPGGLISSLTYFGPAYSSSFGNSLFARF